MLFTTANSTQMLKPALEYTVWTQLFPYTLLIVWFGAFVIALIHPVSRAFLHCTWVAFTKFPLCRTHIEYEKGASIFYLRVTCIALVDDDRNIVRVFYGTPDVLFRKQTK